MRRFFLAGLAVCGIYCLGAVGVAAQDEEPNCDAPKTQMDMTACAGIDYEEADAELNTEYKKTRKVLAEWDEPKDGDAQGAVDALVAAQRAWVAFRDVNCEAFGFQARGGSMEPMLVSACRADMSRKRTQELRQLWEGF